MSLGAPWAPPHTHAQTARLTSHTVGRRRSAWHVKTANAAKHTVLCHRWHRRGTHGCAAMPLRSHRSMRTHISLGHTAADMPCQRTHTATESQELACRPARLAPHRHRPRTSLEPHPVRARTQGLAHHTGCAVRARHVGDGNHRGNTPCHLPLCPRTCVRRGVFGVALAPSSHGRTV